MTGAYVPSAYDTVIPYAGSLPFSNFAAPYADPDIRLLHSLPIQSFDRRRVEQDHGHGRAAELDGIQGGRIEDAHGPEAENGEQGRVAQGDADLPAQGGVGDEAGGADGGTPEGCFERTDTGGQTVFGDQADDRPGKDGQQDQD